MKSKSRILNEAVSREAELELLCSQCGLCCHLKVPLVDGSFGIHPTDTCEFLGEDNRCTVYENRFEKCSTCLTRDQMVAKDYILPEGCPYTRLREGYKASRVLTEEELEYELALHDFLSAFRPV